MWGRVDPCDPWGWWADGGWDGKSFSGRWADRLCDLVGLGSIDAVLIGHG